MTSQPNRDAAELPGIAKEPIESLLQLIATEETLPGAAVVACLERMDEAAPVLIDVIERAAEGEELSDEDALLLFRGLHMLGGAREERAFAPLLRLLRLPQEEIDDLLGQVVTETLNKIAAGCFDGDATSLFEAICDPDLNEFTRDALLEAATFLTWDGRIPLTDMRALLQRFLDEGLAPPAGWIWIGWQQAVAVLGLRDMTPSVKALWDRGLIEDFILTYEEFEDELKEAEQAPRDVARIAKIGLGYIEDVVEELESWGAEEDEGEEWSFAEAAAKAGALSDRRQPRFEPAPDPYRHVGRNDPCPCGSGKKFKKCCLAD